ncbi:uncharacterized protein B0T15DRAFT_437981 [Chaetomium strumarium]|uniref:DUF7730 domain-containing protein n=1 Tax=Chaetomium strumarium TaxID=1170767 RepID=A0AAJ0GMW7_9PEZI|nr:hypothetical protein B0T15DRAFT_437981 [Chaetomium strumarium]
MTTTTWRHSLIANDCSSRFFCDKSTDPTSAFQPSTKFVFQLATCDLSATVRLPQSHSRLKLKLDLESGSVLPGPAMPALSWFPGLMSKITGSHHVRRRRRAGRSSTPGIPHQPASGDITWQANLTRNQAVTDRCRIELDPAALDSLPQLFRLPYDIRHKIYRLILDDAGTRQHIFCPSVSRRRMPRELQPRYLLSEKFTDSDGYYVCGHYECQRAGWAFRVEAPSVGFRLGDLNALMKTNKFAYQEISHFMYASINFHFATFRELGAFLDWISPDTIPSIQFITFIAHMLPDGTEHCKELIEGKYFRGIDRDHVALFKRMPSLRSLEITFFPNIMLSFTTRFTSIMKPLEELAKTTEIKVILPKIFYNKDKSGQGLPLTRGYNEKTAFYSLTRPEYLGRNRLSGCEAYWRFL